MARWSPLLAFVALVAPGAFAANPALPKGPSAIPGGFIVELSAASGKRSADAHDDFLSELDKRAGGRFVTRTKYDSPVFKGLAVQLNVPLRRARIGHWTVTTDVAARQDLVDLASIPNVVSVRPIFVHEASKPVSVHVATGPDDPAVFPDGQSPHVMTGVDKAHAQGITGKGVKIGIIDSGVDYRHPSLGGGFGPGFKFAGGYDFVGDAYDGTFHPAKPDGDPLDTCFGHGTHVAGIVGADPGNLYNISGVAPGAELHAYRVSGCPGAIGEDILLAAMLRAHDDGMDVITISLGYVSGWGEEMSAVVASRIAKLGRTVTVSVGNEGRDGAMVIRSPATGDGVIGVGSVDNVFTTYFTFISNASDRPIPYITWSIPNPGTLVPIDLLEQPYPLIALTTDPLANDIGCTPLGDDVPNLAEYAVIIRESTKCNTRTQYQNLVNRGGKLFIAYNAQIIPPAGETIRVAKVVHNDDAIDLINELAKGTKITVTFPQGPAGSDDPNPDTGGLVSVYSNFGPTNELHLAPAVSAPGGNITSTYLTDYDSWAVMSGTSMAAPFIAGSAALLIEAKGKVVAKDIRAILQTTAEPVPISHEKNAVPQTLAQQGAGLVNVYNALTVRTLVTPGELLLNDTAHWKAGHNIVIKNTGKSKQTYTLTHKPAGTTITIPPGHVDYNRAPIPLVDAPVGVQFSRSRVTLAPGASATVTARISPPKNVDPKNLPIVSGWIDIQGSAGDHLKVSYLGLAGSMGDIQAISTNNIHIVKEFELPGIVFYDRFFTPTIQVGPANYTPAQVSSVFLDILMAQASRRVVFDLVPFDTDVQSTIPDPLHPSAQAKRSPIWSSWWPGLRKPAAGGSFSDVPILGNIAEWDYVPRWDSGGLPYYGLNLPTQFANGTKLPFGQYRLLVRALRPFGNPDLEKDYDVYVSEQWGLVESH
ncbi:subtilisin-like protein [Auricularia subglabra TFB-10046 SS5]|nr:subtilisin-like protein [Auricularia subglabra TFB-10046 SS5]